MSFLSRVFALLARIELQSIGANGRFPGCYWLVAPVDCNLHNSIASHSGHHNHNSKSDDSFDVGSDSRNFDWNSDNRLEHIHHSEHLGNFDLACGIVRLKLSLLSCDFGLNVNSHHLLRERFLPLSTLSCWEEAPVVIAQNVDKLGNLREIPD